jgi:large subunit ribosomal protein L31
MRKRLPKQSARYGLLFGLKIKAAGDPGFDPIPPCLRRSAARVIGAPNKKSRRTSGRLFAYFARDTTMKSDIHPNYHMIKVVMTNGVEFMTRSTYGEEGATLNLDIDPNTHPAWTGGSQQLLDRGGRLSRFNTRFGGIGIGGKK